MEELGCMTHKLQLRDLFFVEPHKTACLEEKYSTIFI